jgi:hypothetical protein
MCGARGMLIRHRGGRSRGRVCRVFRRGNAARELSCHRPRVRARQAVSNSANPSAARPGAWSFASYGLQSATGACLQVVGCLQRSVFFRFSGEHAESLGIVFAGRRYGQMYEYVDDPAVAATLSKVHSHPGVTARPGVKNPRACAPEALGNLDTPEEREDSAQLSAVFKHDADEHAAGCRDGHARPNGIGSTRMVPRVDMASTARGALPSWRRVQRSALASSLTCIECKVARDAWHSHRCEGTVRKQTVTGTCVPARCGQPSRHEE